MKLNKKTFDNIALILLVIGGLEVGMKGFFNFQLVGWLFTMWPNLVIFVYDLIGLATVYSMLLLTKNFKK